ncbi:MAG TPA: FecR domain-containing protein [Thermoanaerobaculia bacterium]
MNEERLQALLSVYKHTAAMPDLRSITPIRRRPVWPWLAAAAAVLIAVFVMVRPRGRHDWIVTSGLIPRTLNEGEVVSTPTGSRVRLESREIGIVDVAERTTLRLTGRHRLELAAGTIHAKTKSPPGIFIVDTPRARATDLGCEYVLSIAENGAGSLRVSFGWVELDSFSQTLVPQGAKAIIASDGRLTPPVFEDAPLAFQEAVRRYAFGSRDDLRTILALARRRDALTLINLFRLATPEERMEIYDRLNQLVPAPPGITRDAMQYWTYRTTDKWWPDILKASGVNAIKKKKRMPRGL